MACYVLFEDNRFVNLLPLLYWRCLFSLRVGRKTILDHVATRLGHPIDGLWAREWISAACAYRTQMPFNQPIGPGTVLVNGRWLMRQRPDFADPPFVGTCNGQIAYIACDAELAGRLSPESLLNEEFSRRLAEDVPSGEVNAELIEYPWEIIDQNDELLRLHWTEDDSGVMGEVSPAAHLINADQIHIGEASVIRPTAVIDASDGPVYLSSGVVVEPHAYIRGPVYIGPGTLVKPFAAVRPGTTVGTMCVVGGEISRSILSGYTNKNHEGFLGNAFVGSWVNLGAGTCNSNLKNSWGEVRVRLGDRLISTGRRFAGCMIGDYARLGIGTLIPAGGVIGFAATCSAGGKVPRYVPSFAWMAADVEQRANFDRLLETARDMAAHRNMHLSDDEEMLFRELLHITEQYGV